MLADAGLEPADLLPWNSYPWYINRPPTAAERRLGLPTIVRLIELCPTISVLLLQGNEAKWSWRALQRDHPDLIVQRSLRGVESYHPGRQALFVCGHEEQRRRANRRADAFREVAELLTHR